MLRLAQILGEAGLPPGVCNVVTGDGEEVGAMLAQDARVHGIWFTGSVEAGRAVLAGAAVNGTPVVTELGGKSADLVFADADWERCMRGCIAGIFANAGQVCVAGSRLLVEQTVHERFVSELASRVGSLRLGGPFEQCDLGPLISEQQLNRVEAYAAIGEDEARLVVGGHRPMGTRFKKGFFFEPTVFDCVPMAARIAREEIFGPVLCVLPFEDEDEAVRIANDTRYGLAAGLWTADIGRVERLVDALDVGEIYVNHYFPVGVEISRSPARDSGAGTSEGVDALRECVRFKSVSVSYSTAKGRTA
jgi:acyl-CoA reductase-like NAD-dependent aldehyde dehydrogenase